MLYILPVFRSAGKETADTDAAPSGRAHKNSGPAVFTEE